MMEDEFLLGRKVGTKDGEGLVHHVAENGVVYVIFKAGGHWFPYFRDEIEIREE